MKKLFLSLTLFSAALIGNSQTYDNPESVEYDAANNRWLISNTGSGEILARDAGGTLSVFAGSFASGPHGLEIVGSSVYACAGGSLRILDLTTGAQTGLISMGGSFLNGITHDNSGNIFMTDFTTKKIYRYTIATGQFNVFVTGLASTPNGIVFDEGNNRLVVVNWGNSAPVTGVSLADSSVSTITSTTLNYCDGVTMDCDGNFYISTWQPAKIVKYDNSFTTPTNVVTTGLSNPADIYYSQDLDTLGVPNAGSNTVTLHPFSSCLSNSVSEEQHINLFNASVESGKIYIRFSAVPAEPLYVYDINGRLISEIPADQTQVAIALQTGIYLISYKGENKKVIVFE